MKYLKPFLSIVAISLIIYLTYQSGQWHLLEKLSWLSIVKIFLLYVLFFVIISFPLQRLLKSMGYQPAFFTIFNATTLSNLFNLALPARGGTLYRGFFFKEKFNLSLREYIGVSYFLSLGGLFTVGVYSLISLLIMDRGNLKIQMGLLISASIYGIFPIIGLTFPKLLLKFSKKFRELMEGKVNWDVIRSPSNILTTFLGYVSSMGIYIVRIAFICTLFFNQFTLKEALILTCLNLAINLIQVLPGNLGIKEASFAGILSLMGYSYEVGLLIALVDRAMQVLSLGILSSCILGFNSEYLMLSKIFFKAKDKESIASDQN